MSKPKKGYKRKSVDLKRETLEKVELRVVGKPETAKEYLEKVIERHISNIK
jgi:hypothetical protein